MRRLLWGLLLGAALLTGCGSTEAQNADVAASVASVASVAPASSVAYASVDTDFDSEQWGGVEGLLAKFPGGEGLLQKLEQQLAGEGVSIEEIKAALGPRTDVVALDVAKNAEDVVFLTQPPDPAQLEALVRKADPPGVTREIEGWTAVAKTQSVLDRFEQELAKGSLADSAGFADVTAGLPADALATLYVNGARAGEAASKLAPMPGLGSLTNGDSGFVALGAAVQADSDGVRVVGKVLTKDAKLELPSLRLGSQVPSGSLGFVNFPGLADQLGKLTAGAKAGQLQQALGVSPADLATLLDGEGVLYVRKGAIIPEFTLALDPADEQTALAVLDRLAGRLGGTAEERTVDGVRAKQIDLGQLSLLYAVVDGRVVVTTQPAGLRGLGAGGDKLADDGRYQDAVEAAGLAEGEQVLVYVDLDEARQFIEALGALGGSGLPAEVTENLEPLDTLLVAASSQGDSTSFRLFLGVQ